MIIICRKEYPNSSPYYISCCLTLLPHYASQSLVTIITQTDSWFHLFIRADKKSFKAFSCCKAGATRRWWKHLSFYRPRWNHRSGGYCVLTHLIPQQPQGVKSLSAQSQPLQTTTLSNYRWFRSVLTLWAKLEHKYFKVVNYFAELRKNLSLENADGNWV